MKIVNVCSKKGNNGYWKNKNSWVCPNHYPSVKLHHSLTRCYYTNCHTVRPDNRPYDACYWFKCDKNGGMPAEKRKNSKYCSVDCKNKNARYRYKLRKQGFKLAS